MPDYFTVIDANKFWDAPESDIFPLPLVAVALGISRNRMHLIPVEPIMIERRKCYRKSDILDWALSDDGGLLLQELRSKNSAIRKAIKNRSAAWDAITGFNGPDESKRKDLQIERLCRELEGYAQQLHRAWWPESGETAKLRELAYDAFQRLTELKRRKPWRFRSSWWVIDDPEMRSEALKVRCRNYLIGEIDCYQSAAASSYSTIQAEYGMTLDEWKLHAAEMIELLRADLKALDS